MNREEKVMKLEFGDLHLKMEVLEEMIHEDTPPPYHHSLKFQVEVTSHSFSGRFRWEALMEDIRRFRDELNHMSENLGKTEVAIFKSLEPGVEIELAINPLGNIVGKFIFSDFSESGAEATKLSGSFSCDQTYLNGMISEVRKICSQ